MQRVSAEGLPVQQPGQCTFTLLQLLALDDEVLKSI